MANKESATISQEVDNDGNVNDSTVSTEGLKVGDKVQFSKNMDSKSLQNKIGTISTVQDNGRYIVNLDTNRKVVEVEEKVLKKIKESVSEKLDIGDSVSTRAGDGKVLQVAGDSIMVQLSPNSDYPGQVFEYSRTDLQKESVSKEAKKMPSVQAFVRSFVKDIKANGNTKDEVDTDYLIDTLDNLIYDARGDINAMSKDEMKQVVSKLNSLGYKNVKATSDLLRNYAESVSKEAGSSDDKERLRLALTLFDTKYSDLTKAEKAEVEKQL